MEAQDAIQQGCWQFREYHERGWKEDTNNSEPLEDENTDTEDDEPEGPQGPGSQRKLAKANATKFRDRRMPHATIFKDFELVVKELIQRAANGGEGILVFLPGIGEITELHDHLLPLEQVLILSTSSMNPRRFCCGIFFATLVAG